MIRRYPRFLLTTASLLFLLNLPACLQRPEGPAPVYSFRSGVDSLSGAGSVVVREDDTVWNISKRYRLPLRSIIDLNNLKPPYSLREGQRLRLPAPTEYRVRSEDTLAGIARMYGVSLSSLVKVNQIPYPYTLKAGQVLRMPYASAQKQQQVAPAMPSSKALPKPAITAAAPAVTQQNIVEKWANTKTTSKEFTPQPVQIAEPGGFKWPVKGRVISSFGPKEGGLYNDGINISAPAGAPVQAAFDGVIAYVGNGLESYGNLVLIRHGGSIVTAYAHLSNVSVRQGMPVKKGHVIGTVGSSGAVSSPQLHFEIRQQNEPVDPRKFLG